MEKSKLLEATAKKDILLPDGWRIEKGAPIKLHKVDEHFYVKYEGGIKYVTRDYFEVNE
jgi:hypothetical protein